MMDICALIPARSGSKGIPHKNMRLINGTSLIGHAALWSLEANIFENIHLSTDSSEYEQEGKRYGVDSLGLRAKDLSTDVTRTADVALDHLKKLKNLGKLPDVLAIVQPTSPFRPKVTKETLSMIFESYTSATTVSRLIEPHPMKLKIIKDNYLKPYMDNGNSEIGRQQLPPVYQLTGALYFVTVRDFLKRKTLLSDLCYPIIHDNFINIDNFNDLKLAQNHDN